jgi:hypothetical protein
VPLITQDDALEIFEPYRDAVVGMIHTAWDSWLDYSEAQQAILDSTARANIVHCNIRHGIRLLEPVFEQFRTVEIQRLFCVVLKERLLVRFKKVNEQLIASNIFTDQVKDFRRQRTLPGMCEYANLEIGYQLDSLEREVQAVHLVCPNGPKKFFWAAEVIRGTDTTNIHDMFERWEPEETTERFSAKETEEESESEKLEEGRDDTPSK